MAGRQTKPYPIVIRELEVMEAFDVTPAMRRVVLTGDQLGSFTNNGHQIGPFRTENADDHVKLVVPDPDDPDFSPPRQLDGRLDWTAEVIGRARDYTPRRFDPDSRRLELDFVRHADGLAADWAERARPGDPAWVAGPRGTTVLPGDIDWYFLVGDETALPAIARRIEELPDDVAVTAVISIPTATEEQDLGRRDGLEVTWVHRDVEPGARALMTALNAATWHDGQVYAWAAGEADMLRPVRVWFRTDREVDRGHLDVAGYWRAGQSQQEMGNALHSLHHATDLSIPYAVRAAVTLDLAEHVTRGCDTVATLADTVGADRRGIRKLLLLLAEHQFFVLTDEDRVEIGPNGSVLLEDVVHTMLDRRSGYARLDDAWPGLLHSVTSGESGYEEVVGRAFWGTLDADEGLSETFDAQLSEWANSWTPFAARRLDVAGQHVVDVGGGAGNLLAAILAEHPTARGTLVDLPTTVSRAEALFAERGVADRADTVPQSFFEPLPAGGDVYVLAQVLHDWPDAEVELILSRAAAATGPDGRVVLLERLLGSDADDHARAHDLLMYTVFASGERSREEYEALAARVGLVCTDQRPVRGDLHLLEFRGR